MGKITNNKLLNKGQRIKKLNERRQRNISEYRKVLQKKNCQINTLVKEIKEYRAEYDDDSTLLKMEAQLATLRKEYDFIQTKIDKNLEMSGF